MASNHRVFWYGGQGSTAVFVKAAEQARQDARSSSIAALLLARCHEAYLKDAASPAFKDVFGSDAPSFALPESLLEIPIQYRDNPVFESIIICLLQHLRTIACWYSESKSFEDWTSNIVESSGFCSGLLPACAIATSSSVSQYLEQAVIAFRTAFWIGLRSAAKCKTISGAVPSEGSRSWNLMVAGPIEEHSHAIHASSQSDFPVRIAAQIDDKTRSYCGSPADLQKLAASIGSSARFSHVHGIYHGGSPMRQVVADIIQDLSREKISFPTAKDLRHALRLTSGPDLVLRPGVEEPQSPLIELILNSMLVDTVNWPHVADATAQHADQDGDTKYSILCFGPIVSLLHSYLKKHSLSPAVDFRDASHSIPPKISATKPVDDIAIVGMAFKLPGANNSEELWETLLNGESHVSKIPPSRFDLATYQSADQASTRRMQASHGYFLDQIDSFDPSYFNMSPREARVMDPQQRLLLQTAKAALEDAGLVLDSTASSQRDSLGCWIGVATGDYDHNLRDNIDVYYSTGTLRAFLSGKISYALKLAGPSMVIDTACSSSLVSIHQACRSLQSGDCKAAIAGGVNTISSPDMYLGLDRAHFLSPTGGCRPFDKAADGYGRAEGCVLYVLKPLSTAIAENDRIHAVIRGSDINQCGLSSSITHPHGGTQARLFRQVLHRTQLEPAQIDFVEAHGTGTQAGDTTEIGSLYEVFNTSREEAIHVSSIKGNCGHTEAASGAAGLAKIILMLKNQCFPPQAALQELNPALAPMIGQALQIPRSPHKWNSRRGPRRALLNNFGAAGSNCAMIIEEPPIQAEIIESGARTGFPFILTAKTPKALARTIERHIEFLADKKQSSLALAQVCYSACARVTHHDYRVGFACDSMEHLLEQLRATDANKAIRETSTKKPLVFVFSGQGGLYFGMGGADLLDSTPVIGKCVQECIELVQSMGVPDMASYFRDSNSQEQINDSKHAVGSQCACVILEYAIATALIEWGLRPTVVLGHSLGEYAALAIAGVLPIKSVLRVVIKRAQLMQSHCEESVSGMLATQLNADAANNFLQTHMPGSSLQVSCRNGSKDCVIGGTLEDLESLKQSFDQQSTKARRLSVPYAFHTSFIEPITEPLSAECRDLPWAPAAIPILSNVTGKEITQEDFAPEYFALHARNEVNFTESIEILQRSYGVSDGAVVDIGPHPTSLPMFKGSLAEKCPPLLSTLKKGSQSWINLSESLAKLACEGYKIKWRAVYNGITPQFVPLPGHPLLEAPYFVHHREPAKASEGTVQLIQEPRRATDFELLPWFLPESQQGVPQVFKTSLRRLSKHIQGHAVGGSPICPASVYSEMMSEAMSLTSQDRTSTYETSKMSFLSPLIYHPSKDEHEVIIRLSTDDNWSTSSVRVYSVSPEEKNETLHCRATVLRTSPDEWVKHWTKTAAMVQRQSAYLHKDTTEEMNIFTTPILYDIVFRRVVRYSEMYQSIRRLRVVPESLQAVGTFALRPDALKGSYIVPPAFADTLLHAAGFVANSLSSSSEIAVCGEVDSIRVKHRDIKWDEEFSLYCSLYETGNSMFVADAYAVNASGAIIGGIEGMHFKRLNLMGFQRHLAHVSANGKVDKQKAPTASATNGQDGMPSMPLGTPRPAEEAKDRVSALVMNISGARSLDMDAKLSDLGIDSLLTIELKTALDKDFPGNNVIVDADQTAGQLAEGMLRLGGVMNGASSPTNGTSTPSTNSTSTDRPSTAATDLSTAPSSPVGERAKDQVVSTSSQMSTDALRGILSEICGVDLDSLTPQTSLESIGLDSLLSIELRSAMRNVYGDHISENAIEKCEKVKDLLDVAAAHAAPAGPQLSVAKPKIKAPANSDFISVLRRSDDGRAPLCIVHDGSGLSTKYGHIGHVGRTLVGLSSPYFDDPHLIAKHVEMMAHEYLAGIKVSTKFDSSKGIVFAGWSFGGVVAFMMAHLASAHGLQAKGLILIDSPLPILHAPLPAAVIQQISGRGASTSIKASTAVRRIQEKVQSQFTANAGMLGHFDPPRSGLNGVCQVVIIRSKETFDAQGRCGVGYPWLDNHHERDVAIQRWKNELILRDDVIVLETPGNHFEVFEPANASSVSAQLKKACEIIG